MTVWPTAIFGNGVSGQAAIALLHRFGIETICYDANGQHGAECTFGPQEAQGHGLVIYSPGFSQEHPWLKIAQDCACICLSELDLAALSWPHTVIGVTGTNGKTTLTEFLAKALTLQGLEATAVGNNGYPFSQLAEQKKSAGAAVCEISSFQAESIRHLRLDALLWTNFSEDHLDRHPSLRSYFAAKWRLVTCLRQPQFFLGTSVAKAAQRYGFALPDYAVVVEENEFNARDDWMEKTVFSRLPQRANALLAQSYWTEQNLCEKRFREAAHAFSLPKHRLNQTAQIGGISFWNDSKATNFAATLAALEGFEQAVLWIGGGQSKGGNLDAFVRTLAPKIRTAFLFGETAPKLAESLEQMGKETFLLDSLPTAIQYAFKHANPNESIVFSPGFSSHDDFKSYAERGRLFEKVVLDLKNESPSP